MIAEVTKIEALVTDWKTIPVEQIAEGIERQMVVGQNIMICRLKFEPFVVTPAHSHPHEQMTLVMKGKAKFIVGSEERIVSAGWKHGVPFAQSFYSLFCPLTYGL